MNIEELIGKQFNSLTVISKSPKEFGNHRTVLCKCVCGNTFAVQKLRLLTGRTKSCGCLRQRKSLVGNVYGKLLVIKSLRKSKFGDYLYNCLCSCGNTKEVTASSLKNGYTKSCGCLKHDCSQLEGKIFNRLTVVARVGVDKYGAFTYLCECTCGNTVTIAGRNLVRNNPTKSCGCLQREKASGIKNIDTIAKQRYANYKANASKRNIVFNIMFEEFYKIIQQPCHYCGIQHDKLLIDKYRELRCNGIDRVDNNSGYTNDNIVPCCKKCNIAKSTQSAEDFVSWAHMVAEHTQNR